MTFTPTNDQAAALESIDRFMANPSSTCFLLEGGAGVGKTVLVGEVLKRYTSGIRACAAPTHKAAQVLRRKLEAAGVQHAPGNDLFNYDGRSVLVGTTASLLGLRPIIADDQTAEMSFGKTSKGMLAKIMPRLGGG